MTDEACLKSLGLDPAKMKSHVGHGPDGYETTYTMRGGVEVTIVRSLSTGVYVRWRDAAGFKGRDLGFP